MDKPGGTLETEEILKEVKLRGSRTEKVEESGGGKVAGKGVSIITEVTGGARGSR